MNSEQIAQTEKNKYEQVWGHDIYRRVSPGELEMRRAWSTLQCIEVPQATLNDYGSGPARATKWFQEAGLDVLGIDIADNASETDVPVAIACLWDMPDIRTSHFGYCCDVLEHIPPHFVEDVIVGIASKTQIAAYFRIAVRDDVMGPKLLGQPLHLTVRPPEWWQEKLLRHFGVVRVIESNKQDLIVCCWRPQ